VLPRFLQHICSISLALNYFAFQVELFEEEYEQNHKKMSEECSVSTPTLNWETFDKNNAPKAFTIQPTLPVELLFVFPGPAKLQSSPIVQEAPVRDKSPPV
jgi:hypothetical protein